LLRRAEQNNLKQEKQKEDKQEEEDSSASEYEEIIEEVTDYSEEEEEPVKTEPKKEEPPKEVTKKEATKKEVTKQAEVTQQKAVQKVEKKTSSQVTESVSKKLAKVELASSTSSSSSSATDGVQSVQGESLPAGTAAKKTGATGAAAAGAGAAGTGAGSTSSSVGSRKTSSLSSSQVSTVVRARDKSKPETMPVAGTGNGSGGSVSTASRLSVPSKEDSGTESGEDLRLLAAGLRDTLQQRSGSDASEANRSLVEEVTDALSRLESSLKQGKELAVDGGQRQALLGLVARLQSGLSAPEKLADDRKAAEDPKDADGGSPEPETDSRQSRFAKRRQRNSRHTVGVSREELADARRYMEDMLILEGKDFALTKTPSSSAVPVQLYRPLLDHRKLQANAAYT